MMDKIGALFTSRRFWATVGSVLTVILQDVIGLTPEQALVVVGILQSWVIGDSLNKTA